MPPLPRPEQPIDLMSLPGDISEDHRRFLSRLTQIANRALFLSLRSYQCGLKLHLYGAPCQDLLVSATQLDRDLGLRAATHILASYNRGGRCPVNNSSWHWNDEDVMSWAIALHIERNVWGDPMSSPGAIR